MPHSAIGSKSGDMKDQADKYSFGGKLGDEKQACALIDNYLDRI